MSIEQDLREEREQAKRVERGRALMAYHRRLALQLAPLPTRTEPGGKA